LRTLREWLDRIWRGYVGKGDVWHRSVTNANHVKNGKIKHSALRIDAPQERRVSWKTELSGQLRSIIKDIGGIRATADDHAEKQRQKAIANNQKGAEFKFVGVLHAVRRHVIMWNVDKCDVVYDPRTNRLGKDFDLAHALITFRNRNPSMLKAKPTDPPSLSAIEELVNKIEFTPEANVDGLPVATCWAPWSYPFLAFWFRQR
jgi:hypothetical protein